MKKGRAFSLLSGGLDSLLATRLIMDQGIEVVGLHFITPFFGYQKKGQEARYQERWKRLYGVQARIIDVGDEYLRVVRSPRYGYGRNFNPCIDCKVFLFSRARELMEEEKRDFLISGEVLGQRPMSQRRDAMRIVERDSGTEGVLLRPLCAQHLKPTRAETEGLVDRDKLLAITGRGRKPQMDLAEKMGIRHYPTPAGGCLLTDPELADRFRKIFQQSPLITVEDILFLQVGRHFRLSGGQHLVVGRREEENKRLMELFREGDTLLRVQGIPGPLGLLRGPAEEKDLRLASSVLARYSKAKDQEKAEVQYGNKRDEFSGRIRVSPAGEEEISSLRF
jgi:tRNA U34 2-thiouridine synthase MnmA/TrmU